MKTHTSAYKNKIKQFGRQIDSIITYTIDNEEIELGSNELNSITPHYESAILKSVMKILDIDCNEDIPVGTEINYVLGTKVRDEEVENYRENYDYIDFGNYIVYSSEKQEDNKSYKIICYDKMLYSMVDYETMEITYPITIRNYINAIATKLGLTFANASDTFANYDKEIEHELYLSYNDTTHTYSDSMGYTFRDVLDELSQVTGSTICINSNDELEVRYITDTEDTINEEYLKDINVSFGEKYGPINSIVLSRAGDSDRVYLKDDESIAENGLCEINISENQIMNFNDRSDYLPDLLETLDGLEYYLNEFSSTGITYYDVCDKYNVEIGDNTYSCIMFNDEIDITQGLEEKIFTEMPEQSETDYTKADKTDRKLNQTYIIVDKQNQVITSVVNQIGDRSEKQTTITQDIDGIASQVQDIPTITTENEGTGILFMYDLAKTVLIGLRIHPTDTDIIGLYATPLLTVREGLKVRSKGITFVNLDNQKTYYRLPDNLYYYDSETYDEFVYDGKDEKIYIIRRVAVDELGNKSILDTPVTEEYPYQDIIVDGGDFNVFMSSYPTAYIYVKAMIKNDYTDLFATSYEVNSKIIQNANQILSEVSETYETKAGAEEKYSQIEQTASSIGLSVNQFKNGEKVSSALILSQINDDTSSTTIDADKISLAGKTIEMTSDNIAINSTNFQVDKNGNMTANSGTFGGTLNTNQDCTIGNNLYVGQNQSTTFSDQKFIKFSNDTWIRRVLQSNQEWLNIQAKYQASLSATTGGQVYVGQNTASLNYDGGSGTFQCGVEASPDSSTWGYGGLRLQGFSEYINIHSNEILFTRQQTYVSDKRKKKNIKNVDVSWIDDLKVKEFEYKKSNDKQIGLIAQDYIDKDYAKYFLNGDEENYYSISYGNITNALIQYCQEMKKEVNSLKEEIKKLKESDK